MELHPLCTLFPRMEGADFDSLVEDIKANGQREPIIIHDGMILDGGNRYRACLAAGIRPQTMKFGGGNIVTYVISANLHRRHMSAGQRAAIVASAQNWAEAQKPGRPQKPGNLAGFSTESSRAEYSGASQRTQRDADKVVRVDPDLGKQVARGETSLPKAVEKITGKRPGSRSAEPEQNASVPIEPEYTELDALRDQVSGLQDALALAVKGELPEDQKQAAGELIESLRAELNTTKINLDAVTRSRDQLMSENGQLKRQIAMMQRQAKKVS